MSKIYLVDNYIMIESIFNFYVSLIGATGISDLLVFSPIVIVPSFLFYIGYHIRLQKTKPGSAENPFVTLFMTLSIVFYFVFLLTMIGQWSNNYKQCYSEKEIVTVFNGNHIEVEARKCKYMNLQTGKWKMGEAFIKD